jgi:hypothetical protein
VEDIAYCLLGIFDIRKPLIYGEREKAFRWLQEEIIKVSDDPSIFAWMLLTIPDVDSVCDESGLLADSPASFRNSDNIIQPSASEAARRRSIEFTYGLLPLNVSAYHVNILTSELSSHMLSCSGRAQEFSETLRNEPLLKSRD